MLLNKLFQTFSFLLCPVSEVMISGIFKHESSGRTHNKLKKFQTHTMRACWKMDNALHLTGTFEENSWNQVYYHNRGDFLHENKDTCLCLQGQNGSFIISYT